ncbi:MAG: YgiQ family radical SAM protein, partial [Anaerofustis stercorihominis]|nr:YgiQ family radical SAM protein [Anaerofustis stercorihominis]
AGNMDSMLNHYSVSKKIRSTDAYTPGGVMGKRPDYASIVYSNLIRKVYKNVPIIVGGVEASLRRLAHYDYWSNKIKRSLLLDSQADLLVYGMGENALLQIAEALDSGLDIRDLTYVDGTVFKATNLDLVYDAIELPDYKSVKEYKEVYAQSFYIQHKNTDHITAKRLVEKYSDNEYVIQNPPAQPLTTEMFDLLYEFDYQYTYHPDYEALGGVKAIEEVKFSLVHNRGCFGSCNFCAITFHQGRFIQTRSEESIIKEAVKMTQMPDFKGYIHDVGGPTANFRHTACDKQKTLGACKDRQCLYPTPCKNLNTDHSDYLRLLRKLRSLDKVKKVFVRSGIRFDYLLAEGNDEFLRELCEHHVSGQLKVAPEHISDNVLRYMGKPSKDVYDRFCDKFSRMNQRLGKKQYLVPYLMSSHPGSTLNEAIELALYLKEHKLNPQQVQDFYPTPSTISTCMYYTGIDPRTGKRVYTETSAHEKAMQRALIQYRNPKNHHLVIEALTKAGRKDLIGFDKKCLVAPRVLASQKEGYVKQSERNGKTDRNSRSKNSNQKSNSKHSASGSSNRSPKGSNKKYR